MTRDPSEAVWLRFAAAALQGLAAIDRMHDDEILTDDAVRIADLMLDRWGARYGGKSPPSEGPTPTPEAASTKEPFQW